ncbi:hypothetical protein BDM02DRAFT_3186222 [Thelephora ganbajun]|uniref:Uncharacterized protein n=1 Tax=Thelephora ganbajun TaxID=370292 RepID=A0ACB6ZJX9_THEGA|nr:hypothetical protein BDM02DRAFT_3186222 [Thelephora ganbajun]
MYVEVLIDVRFVAAGEEAEQPFGNLTFRPKMRQSSRYTWAKDENDIDLDFFCQVLVGVEIEQLKRTSGKNAVIADRSGQMINQEEGDDDEDVTHHEFTLSRRSVDQVATAQA